MTKHCCRGVFAVALIALCAGVASAELPGPARIGELELYKFDSPHPYSRTGADDHLEWVVSYPGATYIRLHFSQFDLAPGDYVEITDLEGLKYHRYEGRGPHDSGEFWAFTTPGDTAVVRLVATTGGGWGLQADTYGRGTSPIWGEDPGTESVCGTQDWQDVDCYQSSYPTEYDKARGAVKAIIGCCSSCTAFKVSDSGQFMTNNHCTASQSGVQSTELQMEYKRGCNGGTAGDIGSVMGSQLLATDYTLDYTLMTSTGSSAAIPCLNLDDRLPPLGERIYIAGHPSGGVKKLSIESTHSQNPTGLCEVDGSPHPGRDATSDVGYYCDTTNGSSGSPVLSGDTHAVVALHHFGGCQNSGGRMDRILGQIGGMVDSCAGGGGSECGNDVIEPGEDCEGSDLNGETCQSLGFDNGTLACGSNCQFDTSGCFDDPGTCLSKGMGCDTDDQCCSNKCRGKRGSKRCK